MYSGKTREDWERLEQATFLYNRAQWMAFSYITCYAWTYILPGMKERMNQKPIYSGSRVKSSQLANCISKWLPPRENQLPGQWCARQKPKQARRTCSCWQLSLPKWSLRVVQSGLAPFWIDLCSATNSFNILVLISLGHEPTLLLVGWSVAITRSPYGVSLISSSFIKWDLSLYTGN